MTFEMPASLECAVLKLRPVSASDFEALYAVVADPLIWEQHPNPDRYRRDVFANYFQGALVGVVEVAYYGEASKPNAIYEITRQHWTQN